MPMKAAALLLCVLASVSAEDAVPDKFAGVATAEPAGTTHFFEPFRAEWKKDWVNSADSGFDGEWILTNNYSEVPGDAGIKMNSAGKRHAMARALTSSLEIKDSTLVVQYEVQASNGFACDGAYLKLLQKEAVADLSKFDNSARYTIMFGPDRCGATDKVHFILQHQNPVSKEWEEKHAKDVPLSSLGDKKTHLYTLVIRADNTFEILVDNASKTKGSLLSDMNPPVNPEKTIDDPTDEKPTDWVDVMKIEDPASKKPDDWDESLPANIPDEKASKPSGWEDNEPPKLPDPAAVKPADWDDEEDGDWEAPIVENPKCKVGCGEWQRPTIQNPDYKGTWYPPLIENPAYKGPWAPRKIENTNYFVDEHPHNVHPISAVGFELLTTSGGIVFDNLLVTDSEEAAKAFAEKTWAIRNAAEQKASAEDGMAAKAMNYFKTAQALIEDLSEDKPMVLAALVGGLGVAFLALLFVCCCSSSTPERVRKPTKAKESKKTDAPTEDDVDAQLDADEDSEITPASASPSGGGSGAKKRQSRKD